MLCGKSGGKSSDWESYGSPPAECMHPQMLAVTPALLNARQSHLAFAPSICWKQEEGSKSQPFFFLFKKIFLFIYFQGGRQGEREGEKHQCVVASLMPPTGDLARNSGMCADCVSNQRPFGSQAGTQSTEPQQPGKASHFYYWIKCRCI